jgi:hypothetical protein
MYFANVTVVYMIKEQTEITSAGYVHFQGLPFMRGACREEISAIAEVRKFWIVKYSM